MLSYNSVYTQQTEDAMSWDVWAKYDDLMLDYDRGRIKKRKLKRELKKLGVDENGFPIPA